MNWDLSKLYKDGFEDAQFAADLSSIGGTATPIALLVVGASFSGSETLLFAFLHVIIKFTNVVLWKMKRMSLREVAHAGVAIRSPFRTEYVIGT